MSHSTLFYKDALHIDRYNIVGKIQDTNIKTKPDQKINYSQSNVWDKEKPEINSASRDSSRFLIPFLMYIV